MEDLDFKAKSGDCLELNMVELNLKPMVTKLSFGFEDSIAVGLVEFDVLWV